MRSLLILLILSTACGRIGFDPLALGVDADTRCEAGLRFVNNACVSCEVDESSCSDGQDEDCDGMMDCMDPDCMGQVCAAQGCATQVCDSGGSCADDTAFFSTSWEDGVGDQNQGGCGQWTGTVGSATSLVASPLSDLDGTQALLYQGININNDEAVYLAFPPQDRSSARFLVHIADWQANDGFRTIASFTTDGQPNPTSANTALYIRLNKTAGISSFELRFFDGVVWLQADLFPFDLDTTYQIEMLHETAAGGGQAGWRLWSADGRSLVREKLFENSSSTRQANAFFFGNGWAEGTSQSTEIYFDAIKLGTQGWLQPLRRQSP